MVSNFIKVSVFIIEKQGKLLLEKRSMNKKTDPGLVVFPGGHIEKDESPLEACIREIKEELGIECKDYKKLCVLKYFPKDKNQEKQEVHYFTCKPKKGKIKPLEAEKLIWIKPNQTEKLDLEVDKKALKKYANKINSLIRC